MDCPAICGYSQCQYKCGDRFLNAKYYDPDRGMYRKLSKSELDYSTYNNSLAGEEIEYAKSKIKEMFHINHIYVLREILKYVKKTYPVEKRDLFDDYYVYQALDDLIPITGNDFNNFHDSFTDSYNRVGYLSYFANFYIFQPFDENEQLPMYYRRTYRPFIMNKLSIKNYIHNTAEYKSYKETQQVSDMDDEAPSFISLHYDFDSVLEYYDSRDEYDYIGIIDQASNKKRVRDGESIQDEFKIRSRRPKVLEKKRETGVPSFKGAVCRTSKDKQFLMKIAEKLELDVSDDAARVDICDKIQAKLYDLEKYSTSKDGNKFTYLIVPANHPSPLYRFPVNNEDYSKLILNNIQRETRTTISPEIRIIKTKGKFKDIKYANMEIIFDKNMDKFADILKKRGAVKKDQKWIITVD